jgi:hypothetical protein
MGWVGLICIEHHHHDHDHDHGHGHHHHQEEVDVERQDKLENEAKVCIPPKAFTIRALTRLGSSTMTIDI